MSCLGCDALIGDCTDFSVTVSVVKLTHILPLAPPSLFYFEIQHVEGLSGVIHFASKLLLSSDHEPINVPLRPLPLDRTDEMIALFAV